ncbi:Hypothetical predicted protein [Paramuricea clavata]|uniref:Uncharacterized protein n=1 Tax=Paramuricea clavata TaxID=317549 RepID=A0A7D9IN45_PARCT|nr:Hypothetical predicted protein [Paramuricea clavata]
MATNSYRKDYKRKWISACRTLTKYNNNAKRLPIDQCVQSPPTKFQRVERQDKIDFNVDDCDEPLSPTTGINCSSDECDSSLASCEECSEQGDSDCESKPADLKDLLAGWVNQYQVKHNAVDDLLKILQQSGHSELPATSRSLLRTARVIDIGQKSGMEYVYFPLEQALLENFLAYPKTLRESVDCLHISLNIDGIPLFKSSTGTLWPILCGIMNFTPVKVFPVALTYGASKPHDLDFLSDTVRDLNTLLEHGLKYGDKILKVSLRCVVCDAPAKAFVKGVKLYSGYFGCDKCCQRGVWIGRVTFPDIHDLILRTDASFRDQSNEEHHHCVSPFCDLDIDMVKAFPIDYMHQLCLGVTKKIILAWIRGKKDVRISAQLVERISAKLVALRSYIPQCFARKPRGLGEVDRWKATEFRQFLLYTGKLVLKGSLPRHLYDHFLVLSVASSILVSPELAQVHLNYAADLLKYFVEKAKLLYGEEFIVYNVHSLIHLVEDVKTHGCLDSFSGFPFENYLQKLKRFVRSGKNPLAQIVKRLSESSGKIGQTTSTSISMKPPNNGYILGDSSCCIVVDETHQFQYEEKMFSCRIYNRSEPMFVQPCDSRLVGVYKVKEQNSCIKLLPASTLKRQAIAVELEHNTLIFLTILHQL